MIPTPNGLDEIIALFGDLDDPDFERAHIVDFVLPYPLVYDGDVDIERPRCHRLMADVFTEAFARIQGAGLDALVRTYGGLYARRSIRGQPSHLSTHSWGIAVDLEPQKYPLGSYARWPREISDILEACGFFGGQNFKSRKDPMHWQFARNY